MITTTIPSICSRLFFFDGVQLTYLFLVSQRSS
jgi:hypothetical protein